MAAEINQKTGEEVTLVEGQGGVFEIRRNGEVLWKKEKGGNFPEEGEGAALF